MNKNLLLLAALGLFASCKKNANPNAETTPPEVKIKDMTFAVTGAKANSATPVHQGTGNFNFMGYGYDITDKYADSGSVRQPIVNVAAFAAASPNRVDFSRSTTGGFDSFYAGNAEEFAGKISMALSESKDKNLFKNTITKAFPGQDAISDKYIYAQYKYQITVKAIKAYLDYDVVKDYITPDFNSDVQHLSPEGLVKKYGTHVLSQILLGEKFNVYFQAKSSADDKYRSAIVGFTYALSKVFGTSSGYMDDLKPAEVNTISEPRLFYEAVGGDPSKVYQTVTAKGQVVRFNDWFPTCNEDNALFIDIMPDGLTPIYDLIADPVKKAEVKSYITAYMEQNQVKL